jgi:ABC-type polysaccharide/polyol phosphate export permease
MLFWQYIFGTLTNVSNSMVANAGIFQKVYFPWLIIPISSATAGLVSYWGHKHVSFKSRKQENA